MATVAITLQSICSGGEHVVLSASVNGGQARTVPVSSADLLRTTTNEEVRAAVMTLLAEHLSGMTRLQARNALQAGITITTEAA